ncbi:class I adenylate-forming enzyme family protein [Cytobacillus oceanisediminis]|uniref:class I adenylate-forming enzyme family protein n=1 Tax=Cytobacillus oceanisediminis TaxID=665099 RepID=UPI001C228657|nr:class I adenylate-forming enzyme family protein [Cytobacillus oceanisediminis]MBU8772117.1 acyl--CoA ligase [Cytobacillus oceanisediminis]
MEKLLNIIKEHRGICLIDEKDGEISYPFLVNLVQENVEVLSRCQLQSKHNQSVAIVDTTIGWRCIPIILALLIRKITIIPVDSYHSPGQTNRLIKEFDGALLINSKSMGEAGVVDYEKINSSAIDYFKELEEVAFILYTSGTTGNPKGVMLTYFNIWSNVQGILEYFNLKKTDRICIIRSLTNASAITGELLPSILTGSSIYLKNPMQSPLSIPRIIKQYSISILCTTPSVLMNLIPIFKRYNLNNLHSIVLSGECLKNEQLLSIKAAFPEIKLMNSYGLTEASPRVSCCIENLHEYGANCVGRPLSDVQVQVIKKDGYICQEGEVGELIVSGPNIMKGYFRNPYETQNKIKKGWLHTSDKGMIKNGLIYILGRSDEMIIRSGMNVFPSEIENHLLCHPNVKEALVFGVSDSKIGQKIIAWVVLKDKNIQTNRKDLYQHFIKSASDARIWPNIIEVKQDLPKTVTGKMSRRHEKGDGNDGR